MQMGMMMAVTGNKYFKTGVGKSYSAIRIGELMDEDFRTGTAGMKKIVFTKEDFEEAMRYMEEKGTPGQVIIIDEAGLLVNSRQWYSEINKYVSNVVMTFRTLRCVAIFITPQMGSIDKQVRVFFNLWGRCEKNLKDGYLRVRMKTYRLSWDENDVGKYMMHKIQMYDKDAGRVTYYNGFIVEKPHNNELLEAYEAKSREFKKKMRLELAGGEKTDINVLVSATMSRKELWKESGGRMKAVSEEIADAFDVSMKDARKIARRATAKAEEETEKSEAAAGV